MKPGKKANASLIFCTGPTGARLKNPELIAKELENNFFPLQRARILRVPFLDAFSVRL
jgi:hypothetical protein